VNTKGWETGKENFSRGFGCGDGEEKWMGLTTGYPLVVGVDGGTVSAVWRLRRS